MGQILSAPISSKYLTREGKGDIRVGSCEMQGYRFSMEDAMTIRLGLSQRLPRHCVAGVFDGHAGQRASAFLAEHLANRVAELKDPTDAKQLKDCVMALDAAFLSSSSAEIKEHGSTCCFSVFYPTHAENETDEKKRHWNIVVANVGDSRAMIIRKDGTCVSLTTDHKPEDTAEEARIRAAGGQVHMKRVDGQLAMSRAIGDWQYKANPNLAVADQKVVPIPDITTGVAHEGDRLFICCDGIVEQMENEDAAACIHEQMGQNALDSKCDPASIIPGVFDLSLQKGSKDNMSGMLIQFGGRNFGNGYTSSGEYKAGPFNPYSHDETFVNAYKEDALKHGVGENEWLRLAQSVPSNNIGQQQVFALPQQSPQQMQELISKIIYHSQNQQQNGQP